MKHNAWILTLVFIVTTFAASGALADPPTWKPAGEAVACEGWDGGERLRCRAQGFGSAIVTVTASAGETVEFSYDEYHSSCGSASKIVHSDALVVVPNNPHKFRVLAGGTGITCREVFLVACRVGGEAKQCADVLTASYQWFVGNKQ
ncbi:MAG TPA: hypothetical protein VF883_17385 [Thermoanaerobaculia bacterium]|jgi:hypothetical protein